MAAIATDISANLVAPGNTKRVARYQRGGIVQRIARPVWTIGTHSQGDTILLDYLSPKEMLALDLCNIQFSGDPGTELDIDIGFQAADGGGAAIDIDGNSVDDDPDYWVDGLVCDAGGKLDFSGGLTARHTAPVLFKERVGIYATLATVDTLTAAVKVQFNLYFIQ